MIKESRSRQMDMVVLLQKAECMFSDPRAESYNFHLLVVKAAMREWMGTAPEMGVGGSRHPCLKSCCEGCRFDDLSTQFFLF